MLNFFKEYIRNKALKKRVPVASPTFLSLKDVKSIGFVLGVSSSADVEDLNQIATFLDEASMLWQGIVVENKAGSLNRLDVVGETGGRLEGNGMTFIGKNQMNGAGVPKEGVLDRFMQHKFDLFISLNVNGDFTLDYIARGVNATMSAGMKNTRYHSYPFVLEPGDLKSTRFSDYLQQLFHYLSIIK